MAHLPPILTSSIAAIIIFSAFSALTFLMSSNMLSVLAIPELLNIVLENVLDSPSLAAIAVTSHYFADVALPILWKSRQIHLEFLYCTLPERARLSLMSGPTYPSDWARYLYYSKHVRNLHMSICFFNPYLLTPPVVDNVCLHSVNLARLLLGPSNRIDVTFPRAQTINYYPSRYTLEGRTRLVYPPLDSALCSLFCKLPSLRTIQLGSSRHLPALENVQFMSELLHTLILYYEDRALVKILDHFRMPQVRNVRLCQYTPWSDLYNVLYKLKLSCPSLNNLSVESLPLSWDTTETLPIIELPDVFSALENLHLAHLKLDIQAIVMLPNSLQVWRTITDRVCDLRSLILITSDCSSFGETTSIDLDVVVFLVSSLPVLEILLVPIIAIDEPLLRVSKETYAHPLHTLGTFFGNPPLSWAHSITVCLKSIQDFAPKIYDIEIGKVGTSCDTWSLVRKMISKSKENNKDQDSS